MAGLPSGLAPAPTIQQIIGGIKNQGMSYGSSNGGGTSVSPTGQTTYYSGSSSSMGGGSSPSQPQSVIAPTPTETTSTLPIGLQPSPSPFSGGLSSQFSSQTPIPFGSGYLNPLTQQSFKRQDYNPMTSSVVSDYNPSSFNNKAPYGSPNLFENIGFAFNNLWNNRGSTIDQPEKLFTGFSVFNKDIAQSPVEPFGTRPSSSKESFYNFNSIKSTTDVPSSLTSGFKNLFTTGLLIAAPEVGFGYVVGKGYNDLAQGGGKMYNAMKEPDIGGYESFGMISTGKYGVTGSYNARGLQEDISSGRSQAIGGLFNIGLGAWGFNTYKTNLGNQFLKEDIKATLDTRPTLSVSNVVKQDNIYTEAVNYKQSSSVGSADTLGAVEYKVTGGKYDILRGQSTTVVKTQDFFTGEPIIFSGQQSISGSGVLLPTGTGTGSFSKITTTETANAFFTPSQEIFGKSNGMVGKIDVFTGGEQTTNFYGSLSKQRGQFALSLSGKTSEAGIDYGKLGSQIINPNFNFKFPIQDIKVSRIIERNPSASEFIPSENLGLKANPSSPSLISRGVSQQSIVPSLTKSIELNPTRNIFPKTSNLFTKSSSSQSVIQQTQSVGFNIPSMVGGQGLKTSQDVIVIPRMNVNQKIDLGQQSKNRLFTSSASSSASSFAQPSGQILPTIQIQPTMQIQETKTINKLGFGNSIIPSPRINPTTPTFSTPFIPPTLNLPFSSGKNKKSYQFGNRKTKYLPDIGSVILGKTSMKIPGSYKIGAGALSMRPIIVSRKPIIINKGKRRKKR
jgi:hypothetical protein